MIRRKSPVVLAILLAVCAFGSVSNFAHKYGLGSTDYKPLIVESNSMEPTIMTGAVIVVQYCSIDDVEIGDIITFYAPQLHKYNTHRVIEIGEDYMRTQGDNASKPDEGTVINDALVGKVVHVWNWAARYTGAFNRDGWFARYTLMVALFSVVTILSLIWIIVFLLVVARWLFLVVVLLLGGALTTKFYKALRQDTDKLTALLDEPLPKSIIKRISLYDTLSKIHRETKHYKR